MIATQKNGKEVTFTLNNVKFVPGLHRNLLSIGTIMKNGGEITSKGQELTIRKGSFKLTLDQVIKAGEGFLMV